MRARIPITPEGWPFILIPGAAACALAGTGWSWLAVPPALLALLSLGFFRDPERTPPAVPGAVVAPADGRVREVRELHDPFVGEAVRVSIFLSPLDVHVNRSPIAALVTEVEYRSGRFMAAYRPEASEGNERCRIALQGESARVAVSQIAGVVARRVVCRVRPGDKLRAGERFGLIRFGSRTDLFVPKGTALRCRQGDKVRGGETIMGVLR
ncbi:MAG: phosphatidylserine decarboxylase family protein [Candidatus Rokubacteria bacterium]|nr:phosphatidylserine decarboxylase family protein [Candidatus Rokubacteria bacterium]